jgi:hypothetical protein
VQDVGARRSDVQDHFPVNIAPIASYRVILRTVLRKSLSRKGQLHFFANILTNHAYSYIKELQRQAKQSRADGGGLEAKDAPGPSSAVGGRDEGRGNLHLLTPKD